MNMNFRCPPVVCQASGQRHQNPLTPTRALPNGCQSVKALNAPRPNCSPLPQLSVERGSSERHPDTKASAQGPESGFLFVLGPSGPNQGAAC